VTDVELIERRVCTEFPTVAAELTRLRAALKLAQTVLARVQWRGEGGFWEMGGCPDCGELDAGEGKRAHDKDCDIDRVLGTRL
jgi:hypothetical protein